MSVWDELPNFRREEFNRPGGIDPEALRLLQQVRTMAGLPFRITSDYRPPDVNAVIGGSPYSLHMAGRAFDFVIDPWSSEGLWVVAKSVILVGELGSTPNTQFEIVDSERDQHIHLGWYPHGDTRSSKLYVKAD